MNLNYILPTMTRPTKCAFYEQFDHSWRWLNVMVEENPDINFFFTIETTDIFEKEWDYNEVAIKPERPEGDDPRAGHEIPPLM